jgi:hypothetical protein
MKRILLLDHPQFTSCTYYLWHGLRELEERYPEELLVTVYPFIPTHYDETDFKLPDMPWFNWLSGLVQAWKKHPAGLPFGIPPFQDSETLTSLDTTEIRRNQTTPRLFHQRNLMADEETVVKRLREKWFDLIILGNSHRVPTILLAMLKARLGTTLPPVVYLDAGERDELNEHWIHAFRPDVVFKQILTPEVKARGLTTPIPGYSLKMYPLPLSSPIVDQNIEFFRIPIQWLRSFSNCRINPKVFPVFYHMGATWPERQAVMEALDRWVENGRYSVGRGGSTAPYHLLLAMSKMGVSMRGSGRDTTRYWEIPLYQTALVSDGTMGCIHPYPFEDRKTAFFYRSIPELIDVINRNQKDDREMLDVAERGQAHLKKYHSTAARAVFFLDILNKELNFFDPPLLASISNWKAEKNWEDRPWEGPVV